MARVRVWDADRQWLWPNLPYLLRAHGEERVERYGGIDPGRGIDNDFAAVLIRPLEPESSAAAESGPATSPVQVAPTGSVRDGVNHESKQRNNRRTFIGCDLEPLVSAEWYPVDADSRDGKTVVHTARSDDFRVRTLPDSSQPQSGRLGVWLIYADFLLAPPPRNWPEKGEWDGGILAYFDVDWQRSSNGEFGFEIEHRVPPTDTGFDWGAWSTGSSALEKNLELIQPGGTVE
jgi:hypothetical protein